MLQIPSLFFMTLTPHDFQWEKILHGTVAQKGFQKSKIKLKLITAYLFWNLKREQTDIFKMRKQLNWNNKYSCLMLCRTTFNRPPSNFFLYIHEVILCRIFGTLDIYDWPLWLKTSNNLYAATMDFSLVFFLPGLSPICKLKGLGRQILANKRVGTTLDILYRKNNEKPQHFKVLEFTKSFIDMNSDKHMLIRNSQICLCLGKRCALHTQHCNFNLQFIK